jgi:hypothetical protein
MRLAAVQERNLRGRAVFTIAVRVDAQSHPQQGFGVVSIGMTCRPWAVLKMVLTFARRVLTVTTVTL